MSGDVLAGEPARVDSLAGSGAGGLGPGWGSWRDGLWVPRGDEADVLDAGSERGGGGGAVTADANGNPVPGDPDSAYVSAQTDAYGYQELGGNSSYNPNLADDGVTDLTNAAITTSTNCTCQKEQCAILSSNHVTSQHHWTVITEYHSNWNAKGNITYDSDTVINTGILAGVDGEDLAGEGNDTHTVGSGSATTLGNLGTFDSKQIVAYMKYVENKYVWGDPTTNAECYWWYQWDNVGIRDTASGAPSIWYGADINNDPTANPARHTDGETPMKRALQVHPSWVNYTPYGFDDCIKHDKGVKYAYAAGINYAFPDGVEGVLQATADTVHSTDTQQCFAANSTNSMPRATRYDFYKHWTNEHHYYWGSNENFEFGVPGDAIPHTFFTY